VQDAILFRAAEINRQYRLEVIDPRQIHACNWGTVRGQAIASEELAWKEKSRDTDNHMQYGREVLLLLASLEICSILGPTAALIHLHKNLTNDRSECFNGSYLQSFSIKTSPKITSSRNAVLTSILRNLRSDNIVLVFVDTRIAAKYLCTDLSELFPELCPQYIVGHGGVDGQFWDGPDQQKERIDRLRSGACRLLVATSVGEEGLDFPEMDLVISFKGETYLIQFIQRRGRARAQGSRMIMILSAEERARMQRLENEERIMDQTLSFCGRVSVEAASILQRLHSSETRNSDVPAHSPSSGIFASTETMCFCIPGGMGANLSDIVDYIETSLEDITFTSINKAQLMPNLAETYVEGGHAFDNDDSVVLVNLVDQPQGILLDFCKTWNFEFRNVPLWIQVPVGTSFCQERSTGSLAIQNVSCGEFYSRNVIVEKSRLSHGWNAVQIIGTNLLLENREEAVDIRFSFTSFVNFVLVCADRTTDSIQIYIQTLTSPIMRLHVGDKEIRMPVPPNVNPEFLDSTRNDLLKLSESKIVCIAVKMQYWDEVLKLVAILPVPSYFARMSTIHSHATPLHDWMQQYTSLHERRCSWSLAVILSDRRYALTENCRQILTTSVEAALEEGVHVASEINGSHCDALPSKSRLHRIQTVLMILFFSTECWSLHHVSFLCLPLL
jgi:hypothetical protein